MDINNSITVTQLNEYLKKRFENDSFISSVYVKGEISNFVNHKSGHYYFTLKDTGSLIKCVVFSSSTSNIKFMPENGLKVVVHGRVAVFVRDGIYTLYVSSMIPDGIGSLNLAYEQLKEKLSKEGLFDSAHKKSIPKIPRRIGIITAPTGAAIRDIINVSGRRFPFADILLFPSQVQGEFAEEELINGVNYFNDNDACDVIIIGRGGGSIEDLWAFNSEKLARTIFESHIPIISAVGHETDFTICDFVCDLRAPTPSAAAELAVPEINDLKNRFNNITNRLLLRLESMLQTKKDKLNDLANRSWFKHPEYILDDKRLLLDMFTTNLQKNFDLYYSLLANKFVNLNDKLVAYNPMSIISRGYSAVYNNGKLVKSTDDVLVGDVISFTTIDGNIVSKVIDKSKSDGTEKR